MGCDMLNWITLIMSMFSFNSALKVMRDNPIIFYIRKLEREYKKIDLPFTPDKKTIKKLMRLSKILDYLYLKENYRSDTVEFTRRTLKTYTFERSKSSITFCEHCEHKNTYSRQCDLKFYKIEFNSKNGTFDLVQINKERYKDNGKNNCKYFNREK